MVNQLIPEKMRSRLKQWVVVPVLCCQRFRSLKNVRLSKSSFFQSCYQEEATGLMKPESLFFFSFFFFFFLYLFIY